MLLFTPIWEFAHEDHCISDDYLLFDKIGRQVEFVAEHPDTDIVYGPMALAYERGDAGPEYYIVPIPELRDPWILLALGYLPQTGAPLWRKSAIEAVGGWNDNRTCYTCEYQLSLLLLMAERCFLYCPLVGSVYRQWSDDT